MASEKQKIVRFTVSLEDSLLHYIDHSMVDGGYASRSEFIRDLIRQRMVEQKWQEGAEGIGVLSIIYDHHQRELSEKMIKLQHSRMLNIVCNLHVHLTHHECLETIIIKGRPEEIEKITLEISGLKGVRFASLSRMSDLCELDAPHAEHLH